MRGHSILIVESQVAPFVHALQLAIDRTGAESLVARDPAAALERCKRFQFSAAAINIEHSALADQLDIPVVLYDTETTPRADSI